MTPKWELDAEKYLRGDDLRRLFDAVELAARRDRERGRTTWPRRLALFTLLARAGLRVSEVAALRVGDLELQPADRARVLVAEGKYRKKKKGKPTPRPEYAPLDASAVPTVKAYLQDKSNWGESVEPDAWLFPSRGGHIQKRAVQHAFKQALELAELPATYSPHALRHSYGVYLYRKTKDLRLVQKALRHKRSTTTETYADVLPEDIADGVNGLYDDADRTPTYMKLFEGIDLPAPGVPLATSPASLAELAVLLSSSELTDEQKRDFDPQFQAILDTLTPEQRREAARLFMEKYLSHAFGRQFHNAEEPKNPPKPKRPPKPTKPPSKPPVDRRSGHDRRTRVRKVKTERREGDRRTVSYMKDETGRLVRQLPTREEFIAQQLGNGMDRREAEQLANERARLGLLREDES